MKHSKLTAVLLAVPVCLVCLAVSAVDASAQSRGRTDGRAPGGRADGRAPGGRAPGGTIGRAVPRPSGVRPTVIYPRGVGRGPYRPYYSPYYRPGITFGLFGAYGYYPYGYPYYYGSPYAYPAYGYAYPGYGYPPPPAPGYDVSAAPGAGAYGGLKIQGAPRDAQVFVDGYYTGIVGDFDGALQYLNLQAGPHKIEIRAQGRQPVEFDVNIQPGQTITYHAEIQ
jgi:hypothetical protein